MQIRRHYLILKKSSNDADNTIRLIAGAVESMLEERMNQVLQLYKKEDTVYQYQVEQIMLEDNSLTEILSHYIHDFYLTASENSEARIENQYRHTVTSKALHHIKQEISSKNIYDDLFQYDDLLSEYTLTDLLREYTNTSIAVSQMKNPLLHRIPTPFVNPLDVAEIFEYEVDRAVIEYMTNETFIASERILERVTQQVYDIIRESYAEEGKGVNELTRDILERFTDLRRYEAERIGRTETLKAQGHANYMRLLNNDTVEYKQWIATDDERTRDSHSEQNGQITTVDGTFENGCQYPGDTGADIEEWVNCRCDLVAYYPDPGMVAPSGVDYWYEDDMTVSLDVERYDYLVEVPEFIPSYW